MKTNLGFDPSILDGFKNFNIIFSEDEIKADFSSYHLSKNEEIEITESKCVNNYYYFPKDLFVGFDEEEKLENNFNKYLFMVSDWRRKSKGKNTKTKCLISVPIFEIMFSKYNGVERFLINNFEMTCFKTYELAKIYLLEHNISLI